MKPGADYTSDVRRLAQPIPRKTVLVKRGSLPCGTSGDQKPYYPISNAALKAEPTARILYLAKPKNRLDPDAQHNKPPAKRPQPFPHAPYKLRPNKYKPIPKPKPIAGPFLPEPFIAKPTQPLDPDIFPRTALMAIPRGYHKDFLPDHEFPLPVRIPDARDVEYYTLLSTPKRVYKREESLPNVRRTALLYEPTERILELAKPRPIAKGWRPPRLSMSVSKKALQYKATQRTIQMAEPKPSRGSYARQNYDPRKLRVNPNALRAVASKRIIELSQPTTSRESLRAKKS